MEKYIYDDMKKVTWLGGMKKSVLEKVLLSCDQKKELAIITKWRPEMLEEIIQGKGKTYPKDPVEGGPPTSLWNWKD